MQRGPKPKAPYLAVVEGRTSAKRLKSQPTPRDVCPSPPAELNDDARAEWQRLAPELHRIGLLSELDRPLLAAFCASYGLWVEACRALEANGSAVQTTKNGYQTQHAYVAIRNRAAKDMASFGSELGLSPTSRARLGKTAGPAKGEEDPFGGTLGEHPWQIR